MYAHKISLAHRAMSKNNGYTLPSAKLSSLRVLNHTSKVALTYCITTDAVIKFNHGISVTLHAAVDVWRISPYVIFV